MAITFIYGAPGSGKTYYAVNHLVSHFFSFSKEKGYQKKKEFEETKIVTNIDNFQLEHIKLDDWILHAKGVDNFFAFETQKKIHEKHGSIIYMIDEAHQFFPSNYRNNDVFNWFSYHRHWGQTIYIMSQSYSRLPKQITDLVELTIYAMPRSSSLLAGKDLKYNIMSGREIVDRKAIIKNSRIFDLYSSQSTDTKEKTKNPLLKYIVGAAIISFLLIGNTLRWASNFGKHDEVDATTIEVQPLETKQRLKPESQVKKSEETLAEKIPDKKFIPQGISYGKFKNRTIVFFQNKMYDLKDFPYPIKFNHLNSLIALIPESLTPSPSSNPEQSEKTTSVQARRMSRISSPELAQGT
jgi:hypothetical protein